MPPLTRTNSNRKGSPSLQRHPSPMKGLRQRKTTWLHEPEVSSPSADPPSSSTPTNAVTNSHELERKTDAEGWDQPFFIYIFASCLLFYAVSILVPMVTALRAPPPPPPVQARGPPRDFLEYVGRAFAALF